MVLRKTQETVGSQKRGVDIQLQVTSGPYGGRKGP